MEFQNLIEKRRSVRKYMADQKIPKEDIMEMIRAAQEAPSWKNSQTGRYYCLTSDEMTTQFRGKCLPEGNALKSQNATIIVTTFIRDRSGFKHDGTPDNELGNGWGCYDLGLQTAYFILKAEELGYSTLIMGLRDSDSIRKFLSVPENEIIVSVIAVGIPDEEAKRPRRKATEEITKFF